MALLVRLSGLALVLAIAGACGDDEGSSPEPATSATSSSTTEPPPTTEPTDPTVDPVPVALAGTGTGVDLPADLPTGPPAGDVPATIGELTTWNRNVITLTDGRLIVRGQLATDEPVETSSARRTAEGLTEPVARSDVPVRLFLVDPATDLVVHLSGETAFHTLSNATGEHVYYEIPLTFAIDDAETIVRFTTGWNGAGYDTPHTLWETAIPPA